MISNHFCDSVGGPEKAGVGGSIPSLATNNFNNLQIAKHSIFLARTIRKRCERENPVEFDAIVKESAHDLEAFAQRIDQLIPDYRHNLELLTKGFDERAKSLDPATDAGARELENIRRAAEALAGTASGVKPKVGALRSNLTSLRNANLDHRLTQSANRVIITSDTLLTAYEDLETFALKVSFSADQK